MLAQALLRVGGRAAAAASRRRCFHSDYIRNNHFQSAGAGIKNCQAAAASVSSHNEYTGSYHLPLALWLAAAAAACGSSGVARAEVPAAKATTVIEEHHPPPGFVEELTQALGCTINLKSLLQNEKVVTDPSELELHGKPWNSYHKVLSMPDAVVYPTCTEDVVAVVKLCNKYKMPIVPYGGATSLEGHTLAPCGGVTIDFTNMKAIKVLNEEDLDITVQAGMGWVELNEILAEKGLFFPLDPGPGATVGGMVACGCSGSLAVRYGTMKDNVLRIQASIAKHCYICLTGVLPSGEVMSTGGRPRKSAAGYDLVRIITGSEGTLCVVTEVTLKLQRIPPYTAVASATFNGIHDAAKTASDTLHAGVPLGRCEMMDEVMMRAVNEANSRNMPEKVTLLYEFVGTPASVEEQVRLAEEIAKQNGSGDFVFTSDEEEKHKLWQARKEALWSAAVLNPDAEVMITDVCVPLSKLADLITETKEELKKSWLVAPIVAHAGDGNFHVFIMFDPDNPKDIQEALRLNKNMVKRAISMEGTCTGEHGVGVGKIAYLNDEIGPGGLKMMELIKRGIDPDNIMNPGKVVRLEGCR
eukprot:jgi/Chlat1/1347/Chrsp119S01769